MARVLILCLGNSGHATAARAIEAALHEIDPSGRTMCLDAVKYAHPRLSALIHRTYMGILRSTPEVWDALYDSPQLDRLTQRIQRLVERGTSESFLRMMGSFGPDAVVCTQAYPFGVMAAYKEQYGSGVPLFGVVTDYRPHRFWVQRSAGTYIVASSTAADRLVSLGVESSQIRICGIPVHPSFGGEARKAPQPPGDPRILVMGGSYGLGMTAGMIRRLDKCDSAFTMEIVTGLNEVLRRQLASKLHRLSHPARIHGYVKNMAPLMCRARLLISKPGGATCAEAMIAGLPMLIVRSLPGQEAGNAEELVRHGAAIHLHRPRDMPAVVGMLLRNPELLGIMRDRAVMLGRPDAASRIATEVLRSGRRRQRR